MLMSNCAEVDFGAVLAPLLVANGCHSDKHELVEGKLVAMASNGHPLHCDDSSVVCFCIEEATRAM